MAFGDYDFSVLANGSQQLPVTGSVVRVRSCTGPLRVSIDGGQGVKLNAGQGFRLKDGRTFRDVSILDVSGAPNTGVLFIGDAGYEDQTLSGAVTVTNVPHVVVDSLPSVAINNIPHVVVDSLPNVTVANAVNGAFTNAAGTVGVASGQLLAANAARRYLLVQNNSATATIYVRVDGAAATTTTGVKIGPGGSYELINWAPTGAITAISDTAATPVVVVEG